MTSLPANHGQGLNQWPLLESDWPPHGASIDKIAPFRTGCFFIYKSFLGLFPSYLYMCKKLNQYGCTLPIHYRCWSPGLEQNRPGIMFRKTWTSQSWLLLGKSILTLEWSGQSFWKCICAIKERCRLKKYNLTGTFSSKCLTFHLKYFLYKLHKRQYVHFYLFRPSASYWPHQILHYSIINLLRSCSCISVA